MLALVHAMVKNRKIKKRNKEIAILLAVLFLMLTQITSASTQCETPDNNSAMLINESKTLCYNTSYYNITITFDASNIFLDCNNSILTGLGTSSPYAIYADNRYNITVKNCILKQHTQGMRMVSIRDSFFINNSVSTCNSNCFHFYGSTRNNTLINNTATGAAGTGIYLDNSATNNTLIGNNASYSQFLAGFYLAAAGDNNILINNIAIGSPLGIELEGPGSSGYYTNFTTVINNTVIGNQYGLRIRSSSHNVIKSNNFSNNQYGIYLRTISGGGKPTNNTVFSNTLSYNTQYGIYIYDASGTNNIFYYNNIISNTLYQVNTAAQNNSFNTTYGNYWSDLNISNFTDTNSDGFYDSGVGYPYNATNGGKVSANVEDYYPCVYKNCIGLTSFSPSNGTYTNSKSISLSARSNRNISNVSIKINGTNSQSLSFSSCTGTNEVSCSYSEQSLSQGLNNITINVTDTDGINASFYRNFTFDDVAPAAPTIDSAPSSTSDSSVVLSGGNSSDTASVVISGGASNVTATFVASWKATVPLNCGSNSLTVKAADLAGNANAASVSITRNCATPSSGSSDSTGITQSKSAGIQPSTVEAASRQYVTVTDASQPTVVTFDKTEVSAIELKVTEAVSQATVSVQSLSALPSGVPPPSSPSYSYLSISVAKSLGDKISEAKVSFKVAKSWITENEIDTGMVALNKYGETSGSWISLPTTKKSESETEINYEAQTTGFSIFAITGEKVKETTAVPTTPTPSPVSTPEATVTMTYTGTPAGTPAETPKLPVLWILFAIVAVLVAVYIFWRRLRL
jgi:PGF-pre-PGF domain-containing protein